MLVRITEKCNMGCSHCMINAGPNGEHMKTNIYEQTLNFIKSTKYPFIMLTGGEPTLHPQLISFIELAEKQGIKILILSNGTFIENKKLLNIILEKGIPVQITNDPRFYPKKITVYKNRNFYYENSIRQVSPFHRAVENHIETTRMSPLCFNLRSLCRNPKINDFNKAIQALRLQGKMCTPSINIDGSFAAGESNSCTTFGTVFDNNHTLTDNLKALKCGKCGLYKNLAPDYLNAIGEGEDGKDTNNLIILENGNNE